MVVVTTKIAWSLVAIALVKNDQFVEVFGNFVSWDFGNIETKGEFRCATCKDFHEYLV
jgi:hypothetical protein